MPSKLIGECLRVRLYDDRLEIFIGSDRVTVINRIYPTHKVRRARLINYKHVIHSLIKKPCAFKRSRIRDDLLPSIGFKTIWSHVDSTMPTKSACRFMVGLLALAARLPSEKPLEQAVLSAIADNRLLNLADFELVFLDSTQDHPIIHVKQHDLQDYKHLMDAGRVN